MSKHYLPPGLRAPQGPTAEDPFPQMPVSPAEAIKAFPRLNPIAAARERRFRRDVIQLAWDIARDPKRMIDAAAADRALGAMLLPLNYFLASAVEVLDARTNGAGVRADTRRAVGQSVRAAVICLRARDVEGAVLALGPLRQVVGDPAEALAEVVRRTYPSAPAGYTPDPGAVEEIRRRAAERRTPPRG